MTIVVTGGSGFVGTRLTERLLEMGHTVVVIATRAPVFTHKQLYFINCDVATSPLPYNILERTDAVIHLAGKSVFRKWGKGTKEEIRNSRIDSTIHVVESIMATSARPTTLVCASSTGYYGDTGGQAVSEEAPKGNGFFPDLVLEWESAALKAEESGIRVVCLRTAPVLGNGGLLKLFKKTTRFGFLWKLTKQSYWMPWIHEDDAVRAYLFALETSTLQGVVNVSAPEAVEGDKLIKLVSSYLHRRSIGTMPKFMRKIFFGEFYNELVVSTQVTPKRLQDKGFVFNYPTIEEAFKELAQKKKEKNDQTN